MARAESSPPQELIGGLARRVIKIKTVPGRLWHPEAKHWSVPEEADTLARLTALFDTDLVELVAPPITAASPALEAVLNKVRAAIRARHFSPRTETAYVGWTRRRHAIPPKTAAFRNINSHDPGIMLIFPIH